MTTEDGSVLGVQRALRRRIRVECPDAPTLRGQIAEAQEKAFSAGEGCGMLTTSRDLRSLLLTMDVLQRNLTSFRIDARGIAALRFAI